MNAFVFKPSNELITKLKIDSVEEIRGELQEFHASNITVPLYAYIEASGHTWTVTKLDPIELSDGRVDSSVGPVKPTVPAAAGQAVTDAKPAPRHGVAGWLAGVFGVALGLFGVAMLIYGFSRLPGEFSPFSMLLHEEYGFSTVEHRTACFQIGFPLLIIGLVFLGLRGLLRRKVSTE